MWADLHYDFEHETLRSLAPHGYGPGTLATVKTPIARALVDVNRRPEDLANPDGPVKTRTSYGHQIYRDAPPEGLRQQLLESYWWPYHRELATLRERFAAEAELLLDCHSMAQHGPDAYPHPGQARPLLCLSNMGDEQGEPTEELGWTTCEPAFMRKAYAIASELFEDMTLLSPRSGVAYRKVAMNKPFRGGYITYYHGARVVRSGVTPTFPFEMPQSLCTGPRLPALMVEVNRGIFVGDQDAGTEMQPPDEELLDKVRRRLYLWLSRLLTE